LSIEIGAPDAAGSGIAPKNIIFDDDYALYAEGMAAHYLLLELERAGYRRTPLNSPPPCRRMVAKKASIVGEFF
jgi:hypothetical protein